MTHSIVSVKGKASPAKKSSGGKGKKSVHIRQADNGGFITDTRHEGDDDMMMGKSTTETHGNMAQLVKHVKSMYGSSGDSVADTDNDGK